MIPNSVSFESFAPSREIRLQNDQGKLLSGSANSRLDRPIQLRAEKPHAKAQRTQKITGTHFTLRRGTGPSILTVSSYDTKVLTNSSPLRALRLCVKFDFVSNKNVTSEVMSALSDHQGSVRDWAKFGTEVLVVKYVDYDPFGNVIPETLTDAAIAMMFGYTERSADPLTKLQDNRARAYAPTLGRFISQELTGFDAGDANLYRYTGNHGTCATDPSGLIEVGDGHSHHTLPREIWDSFSDTVN